MLASLKAKIIAGLIAAAIIFGAGWKLRDYQASEDALATANAEIKAMEAEAIKAGLIMESDAGRAATLEELLALMRQNKQNADIEREKEYVEIPVYRDCVVPDSGVRSLRSKIENANRSQVAGEREGEMPAASPAR